MISGRPPESGSIGLVKMTNTVAVTGVAESAGLGGKSEIIRSITIITCIIIPTTFRFQLLICSLPQKSIIITFRRFYRLRQILPLIIRRQMISGRAGFHSRVPSVQPAVFFAVGQTVVITPRTICLIIKILRHPRLAVRHFHSPVFLSVSFVGERIVCYRERFLRLFLRAPHQSNRRRDRRRSQ